MDTFGQPFTTTYDANGYINSIPTPDYGANPWTQVTQDSFGYFNNAQNTALTQIPQMQQNLQNQQSQYSAFSSQYPTFPNAAGIGSQEPMGQPQVKQQPQQQAGAGQSFNPYSLVGDDNTR